MRVLTILNRSSVATAHAEFHAPVEPLRPQRGRREERVRFTLPTRHLSPFLADRCGERRADPGVALDRRPSGAR